jgi:hypothetical protein
VEGQPGHSCELKGQEACAAQFQQAHVSCATVVMHELLVFKCSICMLNNAAIKYFADHLLANASIGTSLFYSEQSRSHGIIFLRDFFFF